MAYPFNTSVRLAPKTVATNAVVQVAVTSHSANCQCGCTLIKNAVSAPLANNRKGGDSLQPRGFQDSLKSEVERSTTAGEDKYIANIDALAFSGMKKPSVVVESYILSSIIAKMEKNTEFFPKDTKKVVAGNCGKRVMPQKLRNKIFGETVPTDDIVNFAGDIPKVVSVPEPDTQVNIMSYKGSVSYYGVMCCHNIWGCHSCARKISERRKNGLSLLLKAHFDRFYADSVTASLFTVPHSKYDDVGDIRKRLIKSYNYMTRSRRYKDLMQKYMGCGSSRGVEVTWSLVNGFHPHIHVLNFFEQSVLLDHQGLADELFYLWSLALERNGFDKPSREAFGCNIVPSTQASIDAVAEYFSKVEADVNDADIEGFLKKHKDSVRSVIDSEGKQVSGWQTEHEMTKWHLKKARSDGENFRYSMLDLVRGYSIADDNGDEESKAQFRRLWLEYRKAFFRQPQLCTRHKHFKIKELELSDAELGSQELEEPEQRKILASIDFKQWLVVVFMNARGILLEKARKSGQQGVVEAITFINDGYCSFFPDDPCGFRKSKTT